MSLTFNAPPVTEVSLGRTFIARPDFLVPHFGGFWSEVRSEFPKVEHAAPIVTPGETVDSADQGQFWLPRVWFISEDSTRLVQLQQNRYHFNWRQQPHAPAYIRFQAIQECALRLWERLDKYVQRELEQPLVALSNELTYTNLIDGREGESAFAIAQRALRDVSWAAGPRLLPTPKQVSLSAVFPIPGDFGELTMMVSSGRRSNGRDIVKLDLTAKGSGPKGTSFSEWSQSAHDFLISSFKDMTTPEMHSAWQLSEESNGQ